MPKYKDMTYTIRKDGRLMKKITKKGRITYLYDRDIKSLYHQYIELRNDLNRNNTIITKNNYTIEYYANHWFEHYIEASNLSSKTKRDYKDCIRLYIVPYIGKMKLIDIKEVDINDLMQELTKKGISRRKRLTLLTLNLIFKKAISNDLIKKNPASEIKLPKYAYNEKKPLNSNTIDLILNMPNELDSSVFMIKFILTTGLRLEEVSPLTKNDIIKNSQMLKVNKVVDLDSTNLDIIPYTKNKDCREVPILSIIYNNLLSKMQFTDNSLLFPNIYGKIKSRTSFRRDLERFLKILNSYYEKNEKEKDSNFVLTDDNKIIFTYHQLRHSYACILHKAGIDLKAAQSFTGHKDLKVLLNIYTHLDEYDILNAKKKLNNYFNQNKKVVKKVVRFKNKVS